MSILEDAAKLVTLGGDLMSGKKTAEGLVDEAIENAGYGKAEEPPPEGKAKVLELVKKEEPKK